MDKYLITGYSGFVSRHFLAHLDSLKDPSEVLGLDTHAPDFDADAFRNVRCAFRKIDLLKGESLNKVIYGFQPHYILHLASYSSVAYSWKNPLLSFSNNTNIFLNLLEQVRELNLDCRVLSVGSSEEYGRVDPKDVPLHEEHALVPISPYAVARVSQEMLSKVYHEGYGRDIVLTRSFNHIGPGQPDLFVISSFARQLTEIKKRGGTPEIVTGNLQIIRDFIDVRDVVSAYYTLFRKGRKGEIYNVCRGEGVTLEAILQKMSGMLNLKVSVKTSPALIRPNDNPIIIGSNDKIKKETGWTVNRSLDQSLADILEYWDKQIGSR